MSGFVLAGRYELAHMLGSGAMGNVYLATDMQTGESVAVKALNPHLVDEAPELIERFMREGQVLEKLHHPNIINMYGSYEQDGSHFIVMEYAERGSLYDRIKVNGPCTLAQMLEIALPVADALRSVHQIGIVHRDVKPSNILIAADGSPRLMDFDLAYIEYMSRMTLAGQVLGTYTYLSPEACNAESVDERTDVWSFGVTLYEMLVGRNPFRRNSPTQSLLAVIMEPLPDLRTERDDLPDGLYELVAGMLVRSRDERIDSMDTVITRLRHLKA